MLKNIIAATCFVTLSTLTVAVAAADADKVPERKRTSLGLYLTAEEAYDKVSHADMNALFLDIRSRAEVQFLGMPSVADANVPFMEFSDGSEFDEKRKAFPLSPNIGFVDAVVEHLQAKGLTKDDPVVVMCRSGDRSARAADVLAKAGFTQVYTIIDGFEGDMANDGPNKGKRSVNGWKNAGLPWSYDLDKRKMYHAAW